LSIAINDISPETTFFALHFVAQSIGVSSTNFT